MMENPSNIPPGTPSNNPPDNVIEQELEPSVGLVTPFFPAPVATEPEVDPPDSTGTRVHNKYLRNRKSRWKLCSTLRKNRVKREERHGVFRKAYLRWLSRQNPEEYAKMLEQGSPMGVTTAAKKSLFIELYRQMWPDKVQSLRTCGLDTWWLKAQLRKDPEFAASILEIELERVDVLKAYSYEQCFHPQNINERMFWLRKIDSDEFGDEPLVQMTNIVHQAKDSGFSNLKELLRQRDLIAKKKQDLIEQSPEPLPSVPSLS